VGVLRQLLHEDDHVAAKIVADQIMERQIDGGDVPSPQYMEAVHARAFCDYVIAGKDQTAEQYGDAAIADPLAMSATFSCSSSLRRRPAP
jgi:hypothetical protein